MVDRRGEVYFLDTGSGVWKIDLKGKLTQLPARDDLTMPIREQLIVELYSR